MKKILIIDDDIMTLRMLKKCLEDTYEVQLENAGCRFVEHVSDYKVDMILLDIEMPVMNGFEVFEKYLRGKHDNIPVVFLSGVSDPAVVRDAIVKGAAGYLYKSSPKLELIDKLDKIYTDFLSKASIFNVLLVGHDIERLKSVSSDLSSEGFKTDAAFSMSDAIRIIKNENVDGLLIMDKMFASSEQEVYETLISYGCPDKEDTGSLPVLYGSEFDSKDTLLDKAGKIFV